MNQILIQYLPNFIRRRTEIEMVSILMDVGQFYPTLNRYCQFSVTLAMNLGWLTVKESRDYLTLVIVYKSLNSLALNYQSDLFTYVSDVHERTVPLIGVSRGGGQGGPDPPPLFLDPPFSSVTPVSHPTRSHRQM